MSRDDLLRTSLRPPIKIEDVVFNAAHSGSGVGRNGVVPGGREGDR